MLFPESTSNEQRFDVVLRQVCRRFAYFQSFGAPQEGFHISTAEADILDAEFPHLSDCHFILRLVQLVKTPGEFLRVLEDFFYEDEDADVFLNYVLEHFLLPIHYAMGDDAHPLLMRVIIWLYEAIIDVGMDYSETRPLPNIDERTWVCEIVPAIQRTLLEMCHEAFDAPLDMTEYEEDANKLYKAMCDDPSVDVRSVRGLHHSYTLSTIDTSVYDVLLMDTTNVILRVNNADGDNDILVWKFIHTK